MLTSTTVNRTDGHAEYCMRRSARCLARFAVMAILLMSSPPVGAGSDVSGAIGSLNTQKARGTPNVIAGGRMVEILETTEDQKDVVIKAPDSDVLYRVRPIATFTSNGHLCRTFTLRRLAAENVRESFRSACRTPSGDWTISKIPEPAKQP